MSKDFDRRTETRKVIGPNGGEILCEYTFPLGTSEDVWNAAFKDARGRLPNTGGEAWEAAPQRQIARDILLSSPDVTLKVVRALALAVLSELNILRTAASLAPRTQQQLINAILAKIDDGSAD